MELLPFVVVIYTATITLGKNPMPEVVHPLSDAFIDQINNAQSTWQAGRNFHPETDMSYIKQLMGVLPDEEEYQLPKYMAQETDINLPDEFDSRLKWPYCPTIGEINDQGSCGSCWAISAVDVMSDRICIHSNGTLNFRFSANDLLACCSACSDGCIGAGHNRLAWEHWLQKGVVSGGAYNSNIGCSPYEIEPCAHYTSDHRPPCVYNVDYRPACQPICISTYHINYTQDLHSGYDYYIIRNEIDIQTDIYKNGPLQSVFQAFEDVVHYKSGVYQYVQGDSIGAHAIRILGWGIYRNTPYWLVANSWNYDWGDRGTFKILRGRNHLGIEGGAIAGFPFV